MDILIYNTLKKFKVGINKELATTEVVVMETLPAIESNEIKI